MSQRLDSFLADNGTRFLLYAQNKNLSGFEQPETVFVNATPGTIRPGPQDDRMYVVDATNKRQYGSGFGDADDRPPYIGPKQPPIQAGPDGHFDHVRPGTREFSACAMYATVKRVMDIWEDYFGRKIPWYFRSDYERMELIPRVQWGNAQSGWGFLEFGFPMVNQQLDLENPYCENFDILAHEAGHAIKSEVIGWPEPLPGETPQQYHRRNLQYRGHHEAFGDLVAIVSVLHFRSVVDHLLDHTKGNLFSVNELSRMGELDQAREIRRAFNYAKYSPFVDEEHTLSLPFTGGAFDVLVEIYERNLVRQGTIPADLGERSFHVPASAVNDVQREFEQHYRTKKEEFRSALLDARDYFGRLMALAWSNTSPENLRFWKVVDKMIEADRELSGGEFANVIRGAFEWRDIRATIHPALLEPNLVMDEPEDFFVPVSPVVTQPSQYLQ